MSHIAGPQGQVYLGGHRAHREFAMAADKIGMQMRFDHVRDLETVERLYRHCG